MFEPFFTERKVLIGMQNRVAIHSNNLGDKSDFRSFKILLLKCKTLSRNNATLPRQELLQNCYRAGGQQGTL